MKRRNLLPSRREHREFLRSRPAVECVEPRTLLSTFSVTSTHNAGAGTLRQAILDANDNPGTDVIAFAIDSGPQTIRPTSELPTITDPVNLDATTQPNYAKSPLIELSGDLAGQGADGLRVAAGGSTIRGLAIANFQGNALRLEQKDGNIVQGNYIGTDMGGGSAQGNGGSGIVIAGSGANTVGGNSSAAGNVISANRRYGLEIGQPTVTPTTTLTHDASDVPIPIPDIGIITLGIMVVPIPGAEFVAHVSVGLNIQHTADSDLIITLIAPDGTRVVLSDSNGNDQDYTGTIFDDLATQRIGLDASPFTGTFRPDGDLGTLNGKRADGKWVLEVNDNVARDSGTLLSWSLTLTTGPVASTVGAGGNLVEGNRIGTNAAGSAALGNTLGGVVVSDSPGNSIGGAVGGLPNLISGNRGDGLQILGSNATANVLQGNVIGLDATGSAKIRNLGNGVFLAFGASNNQIGGTSPEARNVISGNQGIGIDLSGAAVKGNLIEGNYIGSDVTGTQGLGSDGDGIDLFGSSGNVIGGTALGARNVISGNSIGILMRGNQSTGNLVQGNYIGTDVSGMIALGNSFSGVRIEDAPANTIGGTTSEARNVISGNVAAGVFILNAGSVANLVQGNYIGIDVTGSKAVANSFDGVLIDSASNNLIGGDRAGAGNLISGNSSDGLELKGVGSMQNSISGNFIGTDATGQFAIGNKIVGVRLQDGSQNLVGGHSALARNLISANGSSGVFIAVGTATTNVVIGNYIGTDITGTKSLGNSLSGVEVSNGSSNVIGGPSDDESNLISANLGSGIFIHGLTANGNRVAGNRIGTDVTGLKALGNTVNGIEVSGGSSNTIGGLSDGSGNLISGNRSAGIYIHGSSATANVVTGNRVGTDVTGTRAIGNQGNGLVVIDAQGTQIGGLTPGAGNLVSGNKSDGVEVYSGATGSLVEGNMVGTDVTGLSALGNGGRGLYVGSTAHTIGGESPAARNIISANGGDGMDVFGTNQHIEGNIVGLDRTGTRPLGNAADGISMASGTGNVIGGTLAGAGNVISANGQNGVYIAVAGTTGNAVEGNFIGTDITGEVALGNNGHGVFVRDAPGNTIGASNVPAGRNLISGNRSDGVLIFGTIATGNVVQNNAIGTDATGNSAIPNAGEGVFVLNAPNTTIGGTAPLSGNLISGNSGQGIEVFGQQSTGALIAGNSIGTNGAGNAAIGNARDGVLLDNAVNNTIGGRTPSARNIISGNLLAGVDILGAEARGNVVSGNYVGTTANGMAALGNGDGIVVDGASGDVVGGTAPGAGNVVSGNFSSGIKVIGANPSAITVQGNLIGSDETGRSSVGNGVGVFLQGARGITIGGATPAARNLISGNVQAGVYLFGSETTGNAIVGNSIGTDVDGVRPLASPTGVASQTVGVLINDAPGNLVGGTSAGSGNVIGGNLVGISIASFNASGNSVQGNSIGVDRAGRLAVSNSVGIFIKDAPSNLIGGTLAGAGNIISANKAAGIEILGGQAQNNTIQGNLIGTDGAGRLSLPNLDGIYIENAPANLVGGPTAAAANLISGNSQVGVYLFGETATGNSVQGNWIGTQAHGKSSLGNGQYGILLYNASNNTIDKTRQTGNVIRASGIGPIREFTGSVPGGPIKHVHRHPARPAAKPKRRA